VALHATPLHPHDATHPANETMSSISPNSGSLSAVVRSYKSAVTKHAHKLDSSFSWQRGFYDNIICTTGQMSRIRKYISDNVQKPEGLTTFGRLVCQLPKLIIDKYLQPASDDQFSQARNGQGHRFFH